MLKTAHMVRLVDVRRALGRILQVGAALCRVHVSSCCQEALQEGALACNVCGVLLQLYMLPQQVSARPAHKFATGL